MGFPLLMFRNLLFFAKRFAFFLTLFSIVIPIALADNANPVVHIGVSLSLSGKYAEIGRFQKLAYQLWEEQVNTRGGLLGHRVQVTIVDDTSDPATAIKIYQQFTETDKVDFVLGPYSSPITAAVASITEKAHYPMLSGGGASDEMWNQGYKYLFGVMPLAGRYPIGFLDLLSGAGIQRLAIIGVDDTFSVVAAEGAKRWAPDYKLTISYYRILSKEKPDMVAAAKAAQQSGAQALMLAGHLEESVEMRRVLKQIGWTPAAYYASVGPTLQKYRDILGNDAQGTFSTSLWEPREDYRRPGSLEFVKAFRAHYGETPTYQAATAYAACQILEQAVIKANTLDRAVIRDTLAWLDTNNTILGRYAVDRSGRIARSIPLITQWQGDKREIVWPEDVRTAQPTLKKIGYGQKAVGSPGTELEFAL